VVSLAVAGPGPQLQLETQPFHRWTFPDGAAWAEFHRTAAGYVLRFPGIGDYSVSADGRSVSCRPAPGSSIATIEHLYENQVLPLALSRLGKLVFHASAVEVRESTIVFAGQSGRGKSTLAASFAINGYRFLTDDGLVIEEAQGTYLVLPRQPWIRLWDDSHDAILRGSVAGEPTVPYSSKARFVAGDEIGYCDQPRPVRCIYFLSERRVAEAAFELLSPSDAVVELVSHSFLLDIQAKSAIAEHFDSLTRLVQALQCFRLHYPRRFEALPDVRAAILKHCDR
jgi:hypothetical protein